MKPVPAPAPAPQRAEALRTWARVALLSFGGPAGQIAVMHRLIVEEKRWVSEPRFRHALSFCMLLPGPEAQQLATYLGWMMHGWRGGLAAGGLFVLPGFLAILGLSFAYARFGGTRGLEAAFYGLKAAVIAVVVDAVLRMGARAWHRPPMVAIGLAAFVATFVFSVPFPLVLLGAALAGLAIGGPAGGSPDGDAGEEPAAGVTRGAWGLARIAAGGIALWWAPVAAAALLLGGSHVLVTLGEFFARVAVVSFGGAYAVLAYVAEESVAHRGWLTAGEMLDGLGLAESTPGPLIMVVQFVGFLAAMRNPGSLDPWWAAVVGSCLVTWVTFVPSFLWIFLAGPYVERLRRQRALGRVLAGVSAAVVGVIAHLALWFSLHVLFAGTSTVSLGPLSLPVPDVHRVDPAALAIAVLALAALRALRAPLLVVLALATAAGAAWRWLAS